ncbi:MAG: acetate--CoA ligase family protein [Aliidongia sp.]
MTGGSAPVPSVTLTEWQGKRLLAGYGLEVPAGSLAQSVTEAVEAAEALGYPVVLKAVGSALAHKTELGAVKLNLRDAAAVRSAAEALGRAGRRLAGRAHGARRRGRADRRHRPRPDLRPVIWCSARAGSWSS